MTKNLFRHTTPAETEILVQPIPAMKSCSVGFWVRHGSCREGASQEGLAHFLEHAVFKGTEKYPKPETIAEASDHLGGHIDAFTGKEAACFSGKVLRESLPGLVDLLSDLVTAPLFDADELARERDVVMEEINQSQDQPDDWASELFYLNFWEGCPLAHSILGRPDQVCRYTAADLRDFFFETYRPKNLLIVAAGDIDPGGFVSLVEHSLEGRFGRAGKAPQNHSGHQTHSPPNHPQAFIKNVNRKDLNQASLIIGFPAPGHRHPDRVASGILCHIVGGGMSSRLFIELREKRALCYQVGSYASPYSDTGAIQIAAACASGKARELVARAMAECRRLAAEGPTQAELDRVKLQLRTALVFSQESTASRMFMLAHQAMHMDSILDMDSQLAEIDAVTLEQLRRVAGEILVPEKAGIVALGVKKAGGIKVSDLHL